MSGDAIGSESGGTDSGSWHQWSRGCGSCCRRASVLAKIERLVCRGRGGGGCGDSALRGCEVVQSSAVEGVAVGNVSGRSPDSKLSKSHQIKDR